MTLGGLYRAPAMEHFETLLFTACLTLFTSWLSYLSYRLKISMDEIEHSSKGMDDLHEALDLCQKALGAIWENMPTMERIQELVPQFHINQQETNGKHLFDLIGNLLGINQESLQTSQAPRGPDGRYNGPTQIEEENPPPQSETTAQGTSSD